MAPASGEDSVIEVGPGLGSLTPPLLDAAGRVVAVEIDPVLAERLPRTVAERALAAGRCASSPSWAPTRSR